MGECPATIIDLAQRDRRWLQGNLQHARLILARGFNAVNRVHFVLGILAYLASPLWLAFLIVSTVIAAHFSATGLNLRSVSSFATYVHWNYRGEALILFAYTTTLLFLPKMLALLDLRSRPDDVSMFGGWKKLFAGVFIETLIFTLVAPVLMLFHTWFIGLTLLGKRVSWGTQRRGAVGFAWGEPVIAHGGHTVLGLLGALVVFRINPQLALWMSPILVGLILSMPLSYLTGCQSYGQTLLQRGIFQTPEESRPRPELVQLADSMAWRREGATPWPELEANYGLLQAVLDPYVNAVHVSLLRAKDDPPPATEERFILLRATLLREGPTALTPRDRMALLMDADSMRILHHELWAMPAAYLSEWWQAALQHYARLAPAPQTAFSRQGG